MAAISFPSAHLLIGLIVSVQPHKFARHKLVYSEVSELGETSEVTAGQDP